MSEISEIEVGKVVTDPVMEKLLKNPSLIQRELNNRSLYQFLIWAWDEVSGHPFIDNRATGKYKNDYM